MKRADAITEIKDAWRAILPQMTGEAKKRVNGETSYICPLCNHGKGGDGLTYDPTSQDRNSLKCFACGFSGSVIDLYMQDRNKEFKEATDDLAAMLGIEINDSQETERPQRKNNNIAEARTQEPAADYMEYYNKCAAALTDPEAGKPAREYINNRGISTETATALNIGFDVAADPANAPGGNGNILYATPRIIAPCNESFYIARDITGKSPYKSPNPKGSSADIFNAAGIYKSQTVFIVEGLFDCLSFIEAGHQAIALNSAGNGKKLIQRLEADPATASFIIVPDNDDDAKTNEATTKQLQELQTQLKGMGYNVSIYNIAGKYHDANDAFLMDPAGFNERTAAAIKEINRDDLALFLDKVQTEIYKPYATGINFIDALYSGGPEAQTLNVIAAPPACGKTMLCCQMAESIAKQGRPVIYLNLEMSKEQLIARTLAARLKKKNKDIPAAEIRRGYKWTDHQRELILNEVELYRQEMRPHYIGAEEIHGAGLKNIMEYLTAAAEAAKAAGKPAPAVFLDYLHLVKVEGARDLAETIKETCLQLKDGYAVKYNSIVFAILALNRESMKKGGPLTLYGARDSSNIEYTADTFITLDFQEVDEKRINPETNPEELQELKKGRIWKMTLRQQKDRGSGQVNKQIVDFEPGASIFHDIENPPAFYGQMNYL